jgi:hypothetical protein
LNLNTFALVICMRIPERNAFIPNLRRDVSLSYTPRVQVVNFRSGRTCAKFRRGRRPAAAVELPPSTPTIQWGGWQVGKPLTLSELRQWPCTKAQEYSFHDIVCIMPSSQSTNGEEAAASLPIGAARATWRTYTGARILEAAIWILEQDGSAMSTGTITVGFMLRDSLSQPVIHC